MPELPDIVVYLEALEQRILGETLERLDITAPFLLRTAVPPIESVAGRKVVALRRLGKRIVIGLGGDLWLVLHLMIAGRLHWKGRPQVNTPSSKNRAPHRAAASLHLKNRLATFDFSAGTLSLTEAGAKRRASLHLVSGEAELQRLDPGGLEVFEIDLATFVKALQSESHTLKRALADPRLLSGIGNAYSDEILWEARLSPIALTQSSPPRKLNACSTQPEQRSPSGRIFYVEMRLGLSRESNCLSTRDGRPREIPTTLPSLWRACTAHSLRGQ